MFEHEVWTEAEWDMATLSMTPRDFGAVVQSCSAGSLMSLKRCKTTVMRNLFQHLAFNLDQREGTVQDFFEGYLTHSGFLPETNTQIVNNSQFGYVDETGEWCEWRVPAVPFMRQYWDLMLRNVRKDDGYFSRILQQTLELLPGDKATCEQCDWQIPQSQMHSDSLCSRCADSSLHELIKIKGVLLAV
jgi:hypothetical protein